MADNARIGLSAVLEDEDFQKGLKRYSDGLDTAEQKTGRAAGGISKTLLNLGAGVLKFGALAAGAAVAGAAALAGGLVTLALKTAAGADELVELSDKTGIGVERLQELRYIGEQTGTSVETVTGSLARMVRGMGDAAAGTGEAKDAFKTLGISVLDSNGNLRDSQEVFGEVMNALGGLENETLRDSLAMDIFGRSAMELNPLIKAGAEGMDTMAQEAHDLGVVLSKDSVEAAAEFNDKLAGLKMGFAGIVSQIGVAVIPILTKLIDNVIVPMMPAFQTIIGMIGDFITNIGEGGLAQAIGLLGVSFAESNPKLASFFVNLSTGIGNAITWIRDTLIPAFQQFIEFIVPAAGQGIGFIGQAFTTVKDVLVGAWNDFIKPALDVMIGYFKEAIPIAIGILSGFWNETLLPAFNTLAEAWNINIQPLLEKLYEWLKVNIPIAIQAAADFWLNTLWPAISDVFDWISANVIPVLTDVAVWLMENLPVAIQKASDFWTNTLQPALRDVWAFIQENVIPVIQNVVAWLQENIPVALQKASDFWNETLLPALTEVWNYFTENILPIIQDVIDIVTTLGEIALLKLSQFWNETLLPALTEVWKYFNENILPILRDVKDFIVDEIGPKVLWFKEEVIDKLAKALNEGLAKAIGWVKDRLDELLQKLQEYRDKLKGVPIIGSSPSPLEISLLGIAHATGIVIAGIEKLGRTLKDIKWSDLEDFFKLGGGFGAFGGAVAGRYQKQTLDPIKARVDALTESYDRLQEQYKAAGEIEDWATQYDLTQRLNALFLEREQLQRELVEHEERILQLQKQQQDLAFLKSQMDFLAMIKDEGLDVSAILGGLKLGLDADLPALLEAMTRAIREMVEKANAELQIGSPSGVFRDIGQQIMSGLAGGIGSLARAPALALQSALPAMAMAAHPITTGASYRTANVNFYGTQVNSPMDLESLKGFILQTVAGGLE